MTSVHLHLLLTHVPVIGVFVILCVLIGALGRRNDSIGRLGLTMLVGVALVTVAVYFTGEPAEEAVEDLAGVSEALIHSHEDAALAAFAATGVAGVVALGLLSWFRQRALARWAIGAALGLTFVAAGLMAWTANLGGQIRHSEIRGGDVTAAVPKADEDDR
jgi:hypothetical protein